MTRSARLPSRHPLATPLATALLCIVALACADEAHDADTTAATDIPLATTTEHLYTVGALVGEDWETFGSVRSVHFDADGNLHVFDAGAHRVVVVDGEGNHLRTVGTQGEGPGEIGNAHAAAVLADGRTVVYDFGIPAAFEVFDADGQFLRSVTSDINRGAPGVSMLPLPDGRSNRGQNPGRKSSNYLQGCTICVSCRCPGPCWTVPRKRENRSQSAGVPRLIVGTCSAPDRRD